MVTRYIPLVLIGAGVVLMAAIVGVPPVGIYVLLALVLSLLVVFGDFDRGVAVLLGLSVLPVFVSVETKSLTIFRLFSPVAGATSTRLHVNILLVALLTVSLLMFSSTRGRNVGRQPQLSMLLALFTFSIILGLTDDSGRIGVVFYLQTVLPIIAWFIGSRSRLKPELIAQLVMWATLPTLLLAIVFTLTRANFYQAAIDLEFAIPQYRSYFPAVVTCAVGFAISFRDRFRRLARATILASLAYLPFAWSRGGVLMLVIVSVVAFALSRESGSISRRAAGLSVGALFGGLGLAWIFTTGIQGARQSESDITASDNTRVSLAGEAVGRLLSRPSFGDQFAPYSDVLVGGRTADFSRLFPTHNQYLDYGLRGGILAVALLVAFLWVTAKVSYRASRICSDAGHCNYHTAIVSIVVAVAVGNLFELYLTQSWTGTVLMLLFGVGSTACSSQCTVTKELSGSAVGAVVRSKKSGAVRST